MTTFAACPEIEVLCALILPGSELEDRVAVERHVAECPACTARVAELRADLELESRLERALPSTRPSAARGSRREITGYRIVRELGRGGMGIVYAAVQESSGREVALKVVRGSHFVDENALRLFQREIRVLARLKHPGIAALFDAGSTEDGEHWFAMELVEGETLVRHASQHALGARARLALFAKICDAIHAAHQQGVVHRDLKPSNVIVDARGEPRVLDFGLAKITENDIAITTIASEVGMVRGTLPYMSPEQARGDPATIDLRSDVYSLGVVLYELLTGALPCDVSKANLREAVRVICDEPPSRPSTRVPALRGDVETIVLKALEKEPERRYASAAALGDDVRRFLSDEMILARPPSSVYQVKKLVARHKLPFALLASLFVLAIASAVWLGVLYRESETSRVAALESARVAGEKTKLANEESARAERSRVEAIESARIADEKTVLANEQLANAKEQSQRRKQVYDFTRDMFLEGEPGRAGPDIRLVDLLAGAHAQLLRRTDLTPSTAAVLALSLGSLENSIGRTTEAESLLRWGIEQHDAAKLAHDDDEVKLYADLSQVLARQGRNTEAAELLEKANQLASTAPGLDAELSMHLRFLRGLALQLQGKLAAAKDVLEPVLEEQRKVLGADHEQTLSTQSTLGIVLADLGKAAEAEALVRDLIERYTRLRGAENMSTLNEQTNLGMLYLDLGRNAEARDLFESTVVLQERALGSLHANVLATRNNLAGSYLRLGDNEKALAIWREILPKQRQALGENGLLALNTQKNIGGTLVNLGRADEAVPVLRDLVDRCEQNLPKGHYLLPLTRTAFGRALTATAAYEEAERQLLAARAELEALNGSSPAWARSTANALAALYDKTGRTEDAAREKALAKPPAAKAGSH
jgi:eukaryotic-like serine/threonine-protein kinase